MYSLLASPFGRLRPVAGSRIQPFGSGSVSGFHSNILATASSGVSYHQVCEYQKSFVGPIPMRARPKVSGST